MDALPKEIFGQVLRELSVVDRLQCEGVNRHWKKTVLDFGWTEQRKLSWEIVFEGATESQKEKFDDESLIALFRRVGKFLLDLDLGSFFNTYRQGAVVLPEVHCNITSGVCRGFHLLPKLAKLSIRNIGLNEIVEFLPLTLIDFKSEGPYDEQNLTALSANCPNLKSIHLKSHGDGHNVSISAMTTFFETYPRLRKLSLEGDFIDVHQPMANVSLTVLGQLQWLEELYLNGVRAFDDAALTALATGCPRLKSLKIENIGVSEEAIRELERHPSLLDFEIVNHPNLPESVQETINDGWKKKKYKILCSRMLTNDVILRETLEELVSVREYFSYLSYNPIDALIRRNFFSVLLKGLSSTNAFLQLEIVYTLVNIVRNSNMHGIDNSAIQRSGIVEKLMEILDSSKNTQLLEQSLNALRIIIDKEKSSIYKCIGLGLLDRLQKFVFAAATPINVLQAVVWVIEVISKGPDFPLLLKEKICDGAGFRISMDVDQFLLPVFKELLRNNNICVLIPTFVALAEFARGGIEQQIQIIIDLGVVPRLVSLLDHSDELVRAAAISVFSKIAKGTDEQIQVVLVSGVLEKIPTLLSLELDVCRPKKYYGDKYYWFGNSFTTLEIIRILSAVAYLGEEQVQAVLDTGVIPAIIEHVKSHLFPLAFSNLFSAIASMGRSEHVLYLVDHGVIPLLPDFPAFLDGVRIILEKSDTRTEEVCEKFKCCGVLNSIKKIRDRKFSNDSEIAQEIIDEFFPLDVDDETSVSDTSSPPPTPPGTFGSGGGFGRWGR